jgi:prepilin-type N-terminal cleavage/methylation domain-containing protein
MMLCNPIPRRPQSGFTLIEVAIAIGVLATAAALVTQVALSSLGERVRVDAHLEAVETAANILEQAHARPFNDLTPEWASAQKLPENFSSRWPDGRLSVRVEPEPKHPRIKRVTVEIKWAPPNRSGWPPVALTGLMSGRTQEGKP